MPWPPGTGRSRCRRRPTYIIKDVRLFLNSVERGVRLMQSAGVGAEVGRCDTDEEILLTIHIPKRRPARGCYGFVTHFPQGYGIMGWHRVPLWRKGRRGTSMEENIVSSVKTTEAADGARLEQIAPEKPPVSGGRKAGLIVGIVVGVLALAYIAACAVVQFLYNDTALPHTDVLGVDVSRQAAQQIEALWEQQGEPGPP